MIAIQTFVLVTIFGESTIDGIFDGKDVAFIALFVAGITTWTIIQTSKEEQI